MYCFVWFIAVCIFISHPVSTCQCGISLPSTPGAEASAKTPSTSADYLTRHLFPSQACSNKLKDMFAVFWTRLACYLRSVTGDHQYSRETVEIICKSLFVVLSILVADLVDCCYSEARPKNSTSTKLPILSKILYVVGWLTCAIISPISYWPEMEPLYQEIMVQPEGTKENAIKKPRAKHKDKSVETSGPANKKFLKQALEYEKFCESARQQRVANVKRTGKLLQRFRAKWKDYKEELDTKNKLIDEAQQEAGRMERHTIFLQESCDLLQEQLKSQKLVNKSVLQKYAKIHKFVHGYLGMDLQQLHMPEANSCLASSTVKSTTKNWAWLFTNNDINSQQAVAL